MLSIVIPVHNEELVLQSLISDIIQGLITRHFADTFDRFVVFNADLWDLDFLERACERLQHHDIVMASKRNADSCDQCSLNRRLITQAFERLLQLMFNFRERIHMA